MDPVPILNVETLLNERQIREMEGLKAGEDFIEVMCGCTSRRLGDCIGTLKVYVSGQFLINCETPGYEAEGLTPYQFERHAKKEGTSKWTSHIWVLINGKKVPIWRTALLKYYKHSANGASGSKKRNFHRDEFIKCSQCGKERRFRLRTQEQCRIYHDAALMNEWKCSTRPSNKTGCDDEEERATQKPLRGCPRRSTCKGCTSCVCLGCLKCRFVDCNCRTCLDYMQNAAP